MSDEDRTNQLLDSIQPPSHDVEDAGAQPVTDEELARELQFQWDKEDKNGIEVKGGAKTEGHSAIENGSKLQNFEAATPHQAPSNSEEAHENPKSKESYVLSLQSGSSTKDTTSSMIPFDESPLKFEPGAYIPELKAHWNKEGGDASYGLLTRCFVLVNSTQSRIKIVDTLVNYLRTIIEGDPESLLPSVSIHAARPSSTVK